METRGKLDSFSIIHALAYSFIGYQTIYIATNWNPIYWNTACLIVNSGSLEDHSEEEIVDIYEPEYQELVEGTTFEDLPDRSGKIKKTASTDYGKMANAIGDIQEHGITVSLVDINKSDYSFSPDLKNNTILFGLKALSHINDNAIEQIKKSRPYAGLVDFMQRCPLNKTAMISLIKSGAFDEIDKEWARDICAEPRVAIMAYYISKVCEPKTRLNLQNFNGLMEMNLIPEELTLQKNTFRFNKYLKENKYMDYYLLDESSNEFYCKFFDIDDLEAVNGVPCIKQKVWDKTYKKVMLSASNWLKEHQEETLSACNDKLFKDCWNKYASGNISSWEMEAVCFYAHQHELINVDVNKYGIDNFKSLPEVPAVDYFFKRNGKEIPIYKTTRIIGTVISKNDIKSSISLLTTCGVVTVKFTKEYYAMYNRQLSEIQSNGKKKTMEKGWFTRGTKIMVTGFRRDDMFQTKSYKHTPTHQIYMITEIKDNGELELVHERYGGVE